MQNYHVNYNVKRKCSSLQVLSFAAGYLDRGREAGSPSKGPTERVLIELGVRPFCL